MKTVKVVRVKKLAPKIEVNYNFRYIDVAVVKSDASTLTTQVWTNDFIDGLKVMRNIVDDAARRHPAVAAFIHDPKQGRLFQFDVVHGKLEFRSLRND